MLDFLFHAAIGGAIVYAYFHFTRHTAAPAAGGASTGTLLEGMRGLVAAEVAKIPSLVSAKVQELEAAAQAAIQRAEQAEAQAEARAQAAAEAAAKAVKDQVTGALAAAPAPGG